MGGSEVGIPLAESPESFASTVSVPMVHSQLVMEQEHIRCTPNPALLRES